MIHAHWYFLPRVSGQVLPLASHEECQARLSNTRYYGTPGENMAAIFYQKNGEHEVQKRKRGRAEFLVLLID